MTTTHQHAQPAAPVYQPNGKDYTIASLLSMFFGPLGVDRFYLGHIGSGLGKLFTFGGFGIWALIDFIRIITGDMKDSDGYALKGYKESRKGIWAASGILWLLQMLGGVAYIGFLALAMMFILLNTGK